MSSNFQTRTLSGSALDSNFTTDGLKEEKILSILSRFTDWSQVSPPAVSLADSSSGWMFTKLSILLFDVGYMTIRRSAPNHILSSPVCWTNAAVSGSSSAFCLGSRKRNALLPLGKGLMCSQFGKEVLEIEWTPSAPTIKSPWIWVPSAKVMVALYGSTFSTRLEVLISMAALPSEVGVEMALLRASCNSIRCAKCHG